MFPHVSPKPSPQDSRLFDEWNEEKKILHLKTESSIYINPRDIWYVKLGMNIGNEQNGKKSFQRPVLVVRRIGNMYFSIPLTTRWKKSVFYRPLWKIHGDNSWLIVSQARVFDKKRFVNKIDTLNADTFLSVKKTLRSIYFWFWEL